MKRQNSERKDIRKSIRKVRETKKINKSNGKKKRGKKKEIR